MEEKKVSPKARLWKSNGRWLGWKSSDYRRRITKAKPGDWTIIHHKDEDKSNNDKSNFKVIKPKNGMTATGVHNSEEHQDKAVKWGRARARQLKK